MVRVGGVLKQVRRSSGEPYLYASADEAAAAAWTAYPDMVRADRLDRSDARICIMSSDGRRCYAWGLQREVCR